MKQFLLVLLCLFSALGANAQDKQITFKSITASSNQGGGEDIKNAIDGKTNTIWHSNWSSGTRFPVTVTLTIEEVSHVDYLRYIPRQDQANGNWNEVKLEYANTTVSADFVAVGEYSLGGSSTAYEFVIPEGGVECDKIRFTIKSGANNFASAAEIQAYAYDNTKIEAFKNYFADDLYTVLKDGVTSSEGIADADVKALVDNLLTDAEGYKKFRVGEYEAYMKTSTLQSILKTSSQYNNYENPTGVYLKQGEGCFVMVSGIGDYPVGLKIKNWYLDESSTSCSLRNGLNYVKADCEGNVFVNYYTDDFEKAPNVKVHFINAPVQGYWDQETMTNEDWKEMLKGRSRDDHSIIITRSEHAQLAYPVSAWLAHCPTNIDSTMTLYQQVQWAERDIMGLEKYGRQTKNRQLFFATNYGFMAAVGEGAYCHYGSLGGIMKPDSKNFDFWGVGHEWGHNNQIQPGFKWSGCGETTNNIYASWAQLHFTGNRHSLRLEDEVSGVNDYSGMRGGRMQTYFEEGLRKGVQWQLQDGPDYHGAQPEGANNSRNYDHFVKLVPFWQLNLWGTLAGKCPDIIPMVIESIRTTPNYGSKFNDNGKQQVNWMKLACDSAKLDLLPFFEKAGMLKEINAYIEDYGAGWNKITKPMINTLKKHVADQGYPAFTEEINYINAHNFHIYRDNLKLEVPATLGTGCTFRNGKVMVSHASVKNAVAFETYNAAGELVRITMYGLGSDDTHSFTQVLYPGGADEAEAAAYIMAVGYDGTRKKIYEKQNLVKSLEANKYYRIVSNGKGNALSCGASTSVGTDGKITWKIERAAKSASKADQIWQWQKKGSDTYLYNPQSGRYFAGKSDQLSTAADAPAWEAACVDESKNTYTFNIKGGNYMNSYSATNTDLYGGGASDANNIWTVEEVKTFPVGIPGIGYATVCYPFALEKAEGLTAYYIIGSGKYSYEGTEYDYALLEEFESNVIPAKMPVIYAGKQATYTMNIVADDNTPAATSNLLKGTTLIKKLEKGTFLGTMAKSTEAGTTARITTSSSATQMTVNKGYLLKSDVNDAEELYFGQNSVLTGIGDVTVENGGQTFYNLDGTKADKLQRGKIYITSGGKKMLVQ